MLAGILTLTLPSRQRRINTLGAITPSFEERSDGFGLSSLSSEAVTSRR